MPGPGDYEVSRPIIEPNIKSVSNSHSIILKINSTGTSQFKSTNARFRGDDTPVPGPGNCIFCLIQTSMMSTEVRAESERYKVSERKKGHLRK